MEELKNFDEWIEDYKPAEIGYSAVYEPTTGKIISVGPTVAFANEKSKTMMDPDLAEKVISGKIPLHHCYVDLDSMTVEISETKSIYKVDDVLHRIIDIEYSTESKHDVVLSYDRQQGKLEIKISEDKKLHYNADTDLIFYMTDYNDPNILYQTIKMKIMESSKIYSLEKLPERFSIYTNRVFRKYAIETK